MQTVTAVDFKKGVSKTGKPYTMYKITTQDGVTAGGFDNVEIGDQVSIFQNDNGYNGYKIIDAKQPVSTNSPEPSHPAPNSIALSQSEATLVRIANALERIAVSMEGSNAEDTFLDAINSAVPPVDKLNQTGF